MCVCGIFGICVYWCTLVFLNTVKHRIIKAAFSTLAHWTQCSYSDKESHLEQHPSDRSSPTLCHLHICVGNVRVLRSSGRGRGCWTVLLMLCPTLFPPLAISSPVIPNTVILGNGCGLGRACLWLQSGLYKRVHFGCQASPPCYPLDPSTSFYIWQPEK